MKRLIILFVLFSVIAFAAGFAGAVSVSDYPAGAAANGIGSSRHNMGAFGRVVNTYRTTEICVFCHTPHHTNTSVSPAPLWNRVNSASYAAYGTTLGGTNVPAIGSVSLACLSCHDGVTTFDTLVNAPGKGGVSAGGADKNWQFRMGAFDVGPPFDVTMDHFGAASCNVCHQGLNYPANVSRLNLGTDLSNDHPVSVAYNSSVASLRPAGTVLSTIALTDGLNASAATSFGGNLSQNRWAVKGYISETATIADLLKNGKVECSSCHDPHFRNLSWDETEPTYYNTIYGYTNWCGNDPTGENCSDGQFLRRIGGNTGSGVCRTCHNK